MRRLVVLLASTSAIFAGSTAYLLLKSSREQTVDRPPSAAQATTDAPIKPKVSAQPTEAAAAPAPADSPATAKNSPAVGAESDQRKREKEYDRQFLQRAADSAARRRLLDERKVDLRRQYPGLQTYLGLDDAAFDHMLELLAEQQIGMREALLKCQTDHECAVRVMEEGRDSQPRDLAALIGADRMRRFDSYQKGLQDRLSVTDLRGRLPDADHLSDTQAESLVDALVDERQRISDDMAQRSEVSGMNLLGVPFVLSPDVTHEQLLDQAQAYQSRLRSRAAQLLSPAQLATYDQMLAEQLNLLGYMLPDVGKSPNSRH